MPESNADLATFLYKLRATRPAMVSEGPTPEEEAAVAKHFEYLEDLLARHVLVLAGR